MSSQEPRPGHIRSQLAVVRTLTDQVERASWLADDGGLRAQLIEELARLGCRLLDEAGSLAASGDGEDSGVFARLPSRPSLRSGPV
ncbi:MAG TPA: hypothetical protein VIF09_10520 [Polyangiaceae bacterium]|jgi:hypothetical protein